MGCDLSKLQVSVDHLNNGVGVFGMHFTPSQCKMLLHDRVGSKPNPVLGGQEVDEINRFVSFLSCMRNVLWRGHAS